ncbi:MAG: FtsX-like permease family protein [Lachnospiraceae bacterium]|nr:FtsX-like permease family protein [Lachnospiraceae bacterium]
MYFNILKKDLKRKKTMNVILLIFVILAATFIASSANNILTVSNALDSYFSKANTPDYWFATTSAPDIERFEDFAGENGYDYYISQLILIDSNNILVEDEKLEYSGTATLSTLGGIKFFDKNNEEITHINDGEIYVAGFLFQSEENNFQEGGKVLIHQDGIEKEFTVKGYTKDAICGSSMVGMTRFLISESDADLFGGEGATLCSTVEIHTTDADYRDKFNALGLNTIMSFDHSMLKMTYIMDILIAAILLIVSLCLILISMVILRFIINFTITEEFREIGVMKAIGIKNGAIRGLYIVKYFAIAVIGTVVGLGLSFPFSRIMISGVSKRIIISGEDNFLVNIGAAILAGAVIVLFSYLCTRKIRKFSPIDAIRSGETGERFKKKGILHLGKSHMPTIPFMAVNDILSGIKSYVSMIIIFIIGTLLVIIPVNTINTLRSDNLITMFNMVKSHHIISQELLFNPNEDNKTKVELQFAKVREMFAENGIDVDVSQEIMFRSNILKGDKRTNSLSFQGMGQVTTDMYTYIDGTPPQNVHEVALTYLTADQIGAKIGDDVEIKVGEDTRTYTVTAINQSMNNMGEGVRFHQDAELDYNYAGGSFGIQVNYKDNPDKATLARRKALLEKLYPDATIYTPGEYIDYMIGDVAKQLDSMKVLILSIILGINALVAVLMVKSFITKEKSEISLLKAIGFKNNSLTLWQTLRIGIVLLLSVLIGTLLSSPLSSLIITPLFRMMGAYSIEFEIRGIEVHVVHPLIVLVVTALAAFISAQGLRKISSSEISNNE